MKYAEIKSVMDTMTDDLMRLEYVMEIGHQNSLTLINTACTEISGCASRVIICKDKNGFYGDADSVLVRGLVWIIIAMKNDGIKNLSDEFNSLKLNLGTGRINGVSSVINFLENYDIMGANE